MGRLTVLCSLLKGKALAANRLILKCIYSKIRWPAYSKTHCHYLPHTSLPYVVNDLVIGIHLGKTNSCAAIMDRNIPKVLENEEGLRVIPSVVDDTQRHKEFIDPATLLKLKRTAEMFLKTDVHAAMISVPVYFDDEKIQTVKNAGKKAGFERIGVIPEPTAAALASRLDINDGQVAVIYNFGAETFDVSILKTTYKIKRGQLPGKLKISSFGDKHLGGQNFDMALINFFRQEFMKQNGIDLSNNDVALQRLNKAAINAKHQLSQVNEVQIDIPDLAVDNAGKTKDFSIKMTREVFENLVADLLTRTILLCEEAIKSEQINKIDIKEVLLIGGMTKMPKIKEIVEEIFKQPSSHRINPDEAAAIGAAIWGFHVNS